MKTFDSTETAGMQVEKGHHCARSGDSAMPIATNAFAPRHGTIS